MKELVKVNDVEITKIHYKGQAVLTFRMIEAVHKRPEGTARKRFNDNKERFESEKHFFKIGQSEINSDLWKSFGFSEFAPEGILITESGYLLLVKSFGDDLAWEIQGKLVDAYFKLKEEKKIDTGEYRPVAPMLVDLLSVFSALKVPEHLAQIESVKHIELQTGIDLSFALKYAPAQSNIPATEMMFEPTELGQRLGGLSAQKTNRLLEEIGLQKTDTTKGWTPTKTGEGCCSVHSWKKGSKNGYNLKWNLEKVKLLLNRRKGMEFE